MEDKYNCHFNRFLNQEIYVYGQYAGIQYEMNKMILK